MTNRFRSRMSELHFIGTVVAVMAMASPVHASSFVVDDYSVFLNTADPGLRLYADDVMVDNYAFELNAVGQVHTTGLFRIGTEEGSIESDDKVSKPISVSFPSRRHQLSRATPRARRTVSSNCSRRADSSPADVVSSTRTSPA